MEYVIDVLVTAAMHDSSAINNAVLFSPINAEEGFRDQLRKHLAGELMSSWGLSWGQGSNGTGLEAISTLGPGSLRPEEVLASRPASFRAQTEGCGDREACLAVSLECAHGKEAEVLCKVGSLFSKRGHYCPCLIQWNLGGLTVIPRKQRRGPSWVH